MRTDERWVVDASVALKWYLQDEDHIEEAALLYEAFAAGSAELVAPHYIRYEVMNALEVARLQGRISAEEVHEALTSFLGTRIHIDEDSPDLLRGAVDTTRRYGVVPYDGLYLALAEETGSLFVTADARLYRRIEDQVRYARWIGHVASLL